MELSPHTASFFVSFCLFHVCYLVSHYLSSGIFKRWNFSKEAEVAWNSRVVSSVHAVIASQAAIRCLFTAFGNPIFGECKLLEDYLRISLGYLTYDLLMCILNPNLREFSMLIHHTAAIALELYYLKFGYGILWTGFYLLFEITTPLLNILYHLRKIGKDSLDYWPHTAIFWTFYAMWILFRVLPCIYLWRMTYVLWNVIRTLETFKIVFMFLSMTLFTALNTYWMVLITRKMVAKMRGCDDVSRRAKPSM